MILLLKHSVLGTVSASSGGPLRGWENLKWAWSLVEQEQQTIRVVLRPSALQSCPSACFQWPNSRAHRSFRGWPRHVSSSPRKELGRHGFPWSNAIRSASKSDVQAGGARIGKNVQIFWRGLQGCPELDLVSIGDNSFIGLGENVSSSFSRWGPLLPQVRCLAIVLQQGHGGLRPPFSTSLVGSEARTAPAAACWHLDPPFPPTVWLWRAACVSWAVPTPSWRSNTFEEPIF